MFCDSRKFCNSRKFCDSRRLYRIRSWQNEGVIRSRTTAEMICEDYDVDERAHETD
jgi:uncharacterized membrane protein